MVALKVDVLQRLHSRESVGFDARDLVEGEVDNLRETSYFRDSEMC